jgi:HK97 family phage major capsid protein
MASTVKRKQLQEELGKIVPRMHEMADTLSKEGRDFSPDEKTEWEKISTRADELEVEMAALDKSEQAAEELVKKADRAKAMQDRLTASNRLTPEDRDHNPAERTATKPEDRAQLVVATDLRQSPEYRAAFGQRMTPEYRTVFAKYLRYGVKGLSENRALQADIDASGGFLQASEEFVNQLIKGVDNLTFVRSKSTVFPVIKAESLGVPTLDTDIADPSWTGEIVSAGEDSSLAFGKRSLTPEPLSKMIKVSRTLLQKAVLPVESLVAGRMAYKFAVVEENAYLNGTGAHQPLGVFTASDAGVSTSRDVSDDNTATAVTADGLINAKYALKVQYWQRAEWVFNRTLVRDIRKLKDGNGQYLWNAGLVGDRPSTILECPYNLSEYAPNTMTASSYVGVLGDWSFYWIADALNWELQRLEELYAATNQVGFIGRKATDGMPVLAEAFVRVKLGT